MAKEDLYVPELALQQPTLHVALVVYMGCRLSVALPRDVAEVEGWALI